MRRLIPMAICYDFDGTLAPGNMQEYSFVKKLGMTPSEFWKTAKKIRYYKGLLKIPNTNVQKRSKPNKNGFFEKKLI